MLNLNIWMYHEMIVYLPILTECKLEFSEVEFAIAVFVEFFEQHPQLMQCHLTFLADNVLEL